MSRAGRPAPWPFEGVAAGIVVVAPGGRATLNTAARTLLGLGATADLAELPGADLFKRALAGRASAAVPLDWRRAGAAVTLVASVGPLRGAGRLRSALGVFQDVSALAEGERRVREAMHAQDSFFSMVAHDLRTPLTPILGWARLMLRKQPDNADVRRAAEVIERNVRLQAQLVEDMLDFSRMSLGTLVFDRQPLDLRVMCAEAVGGAGALAAARSVTLAEQHPAGSVWVSGDAARLKQVAGNLLQNALVSTPAGGRVHVATEARGRRARLIVSDTGPAVPVERLATLFEMASASDGDARQQGSLGVALALARCLVEAHEGTIRAERAGAAGGVRFTVELPSVPAP